ncbi:MAG: hypothetical protein ACXAC5_03500 [Promethearchaeota archaeon]|jgi:hypothetical protein
MSDIPDWCTDEKCSHCNGTGKRPDGVNMYCPICNGRKYLEKPHKPDNWFLVNSREELWAKWLERTKEPQAYDSFHEPLEYPCLALFSGVCEADGFAHIVHYFYRRNLPLSWVENELAEIGI